MIEHRAEQRQLMLENWEQQGQTPMERIQCFINILITNGAKIKKYGCPIGTLSAELVKLDHPVQEAANSLFTLFRQWLCKQFEQLGQGEKSDELAMHVLAMSQGVASLACAFKDDDFVLAEIKRIHDWLDKLL